MKKRKTTIYFAAPMTAYEASRYERGLRTVQALYPRAEVIGARGLYLDSFDWKRRWPAMARTVDELVFIADSDGFVGRGVHVEIDTIAKRKRPVWHLHRGRLVSLADVSIEVHGACWLQWAAVSVRKGGGTREAR